MIDEGFCSMDDVCALATMKRLIPIVKKNNQILVLIFHKNGIQQLKTFTKKITINDTTIQHYHIPSGGALKVDNLIFQQKHMKKYPK